jgi:hypothetical protein
VPASSGQIGMSRRAIAASSPASELILPRAAPGATSSAQYDTDGASVPIILVSLIGLGVAPLCASVSKTKIQAGNLPAEVFPGARKL